MLHCPAQSNANLQAQFSEYRSAQRDTPEAQLQLQLQEVQAAAARAEDRAARAIKLKKQYKQQVSMQVQACQRLVQQHGQAQCFFCISTVCQQGTCHMLRIAAVCRPV